MRARQFIPILLTLVASRLHAQDWERYKPGSLAAIMDAHDADIRAGGSAGKPYWAISGDDLPTKSTLVYSGEHRPLSPERRGILERWQKSFGVSPAVLDAFTNEYRFRQDTLDIWLAVQKQLEEPLSHEVTAGAPVSVLTIFIGGYYEGGPVTWLFLLNEFDASGS